jgi:hypothetical protein
MKDLTLRLLALASLFAASSALAAGVFRPDMVIPDGTAYMLLARHDDGTIDWVDQTGEVLLNVRHMDAEVMGATPAELKQFYPKQAAEAAAAPHFVVGDCTHAASCRHQTYGVVGELYPGEKVSRFPNGAVWVVDKNNQPVRLVKIIPQGPQTNPNYNLPYAQVTGMGMGTNQEVAPAEPGGVTVKLPDGRTLTQIGPRDNDGGFNWRSSDGQVFAHSSEADLIASGLTKSQAWAIFHPGTPPPAEGAARQDPAAAPPAAPPAYDPDRAPVTVLLPDGRTLTQIGPRNSNGLFNFRSSKGEVFTFVRESDLIAEGLSVKQVWDIYNPGVPLPSSARQAPDAEPPAAAESVSPASVKVTAKGGLEMNGQTCYCQGMRWTDRLANWTCDGGGVIVDISYDDLVNDLKISPAIARSYYPLPAPAKSAAPRRVDRD